MIKELGTTISDAAVEVHQQLGGPGLLESIYESALCHELSLRGLQSQRQVPIPVLYKNREVRDPLYLDILVDNKLIIEVKATGIDYPLYKIQLLTYLRLMKIKYGLLINFGKERVKESVEWVVNNTSV